MNKEKKKIINIAKRKKRERTTSGKVIINDK